LQKQLTAALTERELGAEPLFAAFEAARERKREFLSRIPKEWQGTVTCADTAGKGLYDDEYVIRMEIRGIRPEGFTAGYGNNDAVFMISDGGFAFPAKFRMTSDDSRGFWGFRAFDIEIHQDGQMLSTFEVSREVSGAPLKVTCKIRLSS